jgi:hypothetical protein
MTARKAKAKPPAQISDGTTTLQYSRPPHMSQARAGAEVGINSAATAMATVRLFGEGTFGTLSMTDTFDALNDQCAAVEAGDLSKPRAMLAAQAISLNAIFTEMARRAALNMGEYVQSSERYMRLALKAQAQCRTTVEALERLTNGHEQTVRHVHVDNRGGQAIIADTVNTGGQEVGISDNSMQPERLGDAPLLNVSKRQFAK